MEGLASCMEEPASAAGLVFACSSDRCGSIGEDKAMIANLTPAWF
jgi:hypothetical protein